MDDRCSVLSLGRNSEIQTQIILQSPTSIQFAFPLVNALCVISHCKYFGFPIMVVIIYIHIISALTAVPVLLGVNVP